jgi:hypothetical protein
MVREKVTKKKGHPNDSESSEGYETGSDGDIYVKLLSVKTHWRVVTGNTRSQEAAGALAGTGPSVNGPDPGTRL